MARARGKSFALKAVRCRLLWRLASVPLPVFPETQEMFMTNRSISASLPVLLALAWAAQPSPAKADATPECNNGPAPHSTECGTNSVTTGSGATAVGDTATATQTDTVAVGGNSLGGSGANATGLGAVAVGARSNALGFGTAFGRDSKAGSIAVAVGDSSKAPVVGAV